MTVYRIVLVNGEEALRKMNAVYVIAIHLMIMKPVLTVQALSMVMHQRLIVVSVKVVMLIRIVQVYVLGLQQ